MRNSPTCVDVGVIQSWQARLRLAEGNVAAASRWAKHPQIDPETLPPLFKEFYQITLARILLAEKQTERAESLLEQLLANAKAAGRAGVVIEILILIAQAFIQEHKMNNALETLFRLPCLLLGRKTIYAFLWMKGSLWQHCLDH